jgi:mycothiol synthase
MTTLRVAESAADLETWAELKSTVVPNDPVTAAQLVASEEEGRLLLLAERDGVPVGCGIAARSGFEGRAFIAARVLEAHRRQGIGTQLLHALADHARTLGRSGINAFAYADEPHSIAFAEHFGLTGVDYQLEMVRAIADEQPPELPQGIKLVRVADRREELLHAAWHAVAYEAYGDLPLPGEVSFKIEQWLRDEASRPEGAFVAYEDGELVGWAGLSTHANGDAVAEHGLTAVRRDRRGRGIGRALKSAQIHWASQNGVAELISWTQKGNEAMQALNRSLGYVDKSKVITFQGPLP